MVDLVGWMVKSLGVCVTYQSEEIFLLDLALIGCFLRDFSCGVVDKEIILVDLCRML